MEINIKIILLITLCYVVVLLYVLKLKTPKNRNSLSQNSDIEIAGANKIFINVIYEETEITIDDFKAFSTIYFNYGNFSTKKTKQNKSINQSDIDFNIYISIIK